MRLRRYATATLLLMTSSGFCRTALGQSEKPFDWAGFDTQGSITSGYRFTDVKGYEPKFAELFNLRGGLRLFDFNLSGRAKEGSSPFADNYQFTASGLGGDPFPAGQLSVSKARVYDFRVNFRQSYYAWNRNDRAMLPSGLNGLTSNHNFSTVRKYGSANLLIHATNRLKFRFETGRNGRDGMNDTTRTLDYFGSASTWAPFLRDNPYYVQAPLREISHRYSGGLDYSLDDWSFHYTLGYQTFDQSLLFSNSAPGRSINIDAKATANEILNVASWSESRTLKTPSSEFFYNGALNSRVTLRGDFIFTRYRGPASLDASFSGLARSGTTVAPYSISMNSRNQLTEPSYIVDQGGTIKLKDWLNLNVDYRFNRFTEHAEANTSSLFNATPFRGANTEDWIQNLHQLDLNLEFTPTRTLILRTGVRLVKRDTTAIIDGVTDDIRSQNLNTVSPTVSFAYIPSRKFSIRADLQSITNGSSYTRITPHTDVGSRWVVRYRPWTRLSIENNFVIRNRRLVETDFRNNIRSNATAISWAWNERFSTFAGFSYDSFLATNSVTFLRGTPPLNTTWRDQTVNRVWQGGITAQPLSRMGFSFSGNFVRTTGVGEITLERPNYGPLTFPMATGSVYCDVPKLGRLTLDLQRAYYIEQIVTGDNFSANLLTISWTRDFSKGQ